MAGAVSGDVRPPLLVARPVLRCCDHWGSSGALTGRCSAAGIMSGADVLQSMGVTFSSYMPEPGFPYTRAEHACGLFRDDFDWSTLDVGYLRRIGAMKGNALRNKPQTVATAAVLNRPQGPEGDE